MTSGEGLHLLPAPGPESAPPDVADACRFAALLSDPVRAGIMGLLGEGPHCVCELAAALGERPNNVSNHLARLRSAGLVRASRHRVDARWVVYERDPARCRIGMAALEPLLR
jgi:ArsR family transcriptional regulator